MNYAQVLAALQQLLPPNLWQEIVNLSGYVLLIDQVGLRLTSWGVPAATRFADWLANVALNSPLRPLFIWKAAQICSFLDDLTTSLTLIITTFKTQLEKDLNSANAAKAANAAVALAHIKSK